MERGLHRLNPMADFVWRNIACFPQALNSSTSDPYSSGCCDRVSFSCLVSRVFISSPAMDTFTIPGCLYSVGHNGKHRLASSEKCMLSINHTCGKHLDWTGTHQQTMRLGRPW